VESEDEFDEDEDEDEDDEEADGGASGNNQVSHECMIPSDLKFLLS
jgi:hypothetical protein